MRPSSRRWSARISAVALVGALAVTGCTEEEPAAGEEPSPTPTEEDPQARLDAARDVLDEAQSVQVDVTSTDVPTTMPALLGARGVAARPPSFEGELEASIGSGTVTLQIVSVDGTVYIQPPFGGPFLPTDPEQYNLKDPADLIDPETGISSLLDQAENVELGTQRRVEGEVVQEVTAQLPGEAVGELLRIADPDQPVDATFAIDEETDQLRQAVLTGPFYDADVDSTYTIVLDEYGEAVEITAPGE